MLIAIFSKKVELVFNTFRVLFCYETVSCRLLDRMTRMDID